MCEGDDISVQAIGGQGGVPSSTIVDEIQYYLVTPSGGVAPSSGTNGTTYSGVISTTAGDYYFRSRRTSTGAHCNTSAWGAWRLVYIVDKTPDGGTLAADQTLCLNTNASDINVSGNNAPLIRWEIANNINFVSPAIVANTTTTLSGAEIDGVINGNEGLYYVRAVVDNDGCVEGFSDTVNVRYNLPEPIVMQDASGSCVSNSEDTWVHIFHPTTNNLMVSINDNNQDLGQVDASVYYHGGNAFEVPTSAGACGSQAVLNRNYVIKSTLAPVRNVSLRLYFTDAELTSLQTLAGCGDPDGCQDDDDVCGITDLVVTQITGLNPADEDGVFVAGAGSSIFHASPSNNGIGDVTFGANYIQINVMNFSEFWIHGSEHAVSLPVELTKFEAKAIDDTYIQLNWETATEINNEGFEIERSTNGVEFTKIAFVKGNGHSANINNYKFKDKEVNKNISYYYRLKQVDFDGQFEYSYVVNAMLKGKGGFSIGDFRPNPTKENTLATATIFSTIEELVIVNAYNTIGVNVLTLSKQLKVGANEVVLSTENLSSGTYFINFEGSFGRETKRLVVVK